MFLLQFLVQLPKMCETERCSAYQQGLYMCNEQCYCWQMNFSPDRNSDVNNNNTLNTHTHCIHQLNTGNFSMLRGVEQETEVNTMGGNTEEIIKSYSYCPFKFLQDTVTEENPDTCLAWKGTRALHLWAFCWWICFETNDWLHFCIILLLPN